MQLVHLLVVITAIAEPIAAPAQQRAVAKRTSHRRAFLTRCPLSTEDPLTNDGKTAKRTSFFGLNGSTPWMTDQHTASLTQLQMSTGFISYKLEQLFTALC